MQSIITGKTPKIDNDDNDNIKDVEVVVPLKY